ncbi:DUF1801 domain-containing protein [Brucella sp. IR073]|uniref:DUF1801 domain-containing protein n=1 Tax=unclassified Brucella TaxID=2632610 RepID=UPI003B982354
MADEEKPASALIDARIAELGGWRGETLAKVRAIVKSADPGIVEEWKWENPVWSRGGVICTGEAYKAAVKLTFAKGASLEDPARLFTSSLEGKVRRAIDIREGDAIDEKALAELIRAAVALNLETKKPKASAARKAADEPRLLSGGNPQIAKGYGDAPVQAYIAAMPGWKSAIGQRIDEIIVREVPNVRKAVKWNSPLYGVEEERWFLGLHCFAKYIKVSFFRGTSLDPVPPGGSKQKEVRYLDIYEGQFDEAQFADWVRQASKMPGEKL